jgi:serine/threonine protein kinase
MVMVKFAYGIAQGMEYLHHEVGQRHGDLACRNCLVGPNETIKIGDFGKFEENYEDCYYDCGKVYGTIYIDFYTFL